MMETSGIISPLEVRAEGRPESRVYRVTGGVFSLEQFHAPYNENHEPRGQHQRRNPLIHISEVAARREERSGETLRPYPGKERAFAAPRKETAAGKAKKHGAEV